MLRSPLLLQHLYIATLNIAMLITDTPIIATPIIIDTLIIAMFTALHSSLLHSSSHRCYKCMFFGHCAVINATMLHGPGHGSTAPPPDNVFSYEITLKIVG
jgi:hypothetical protein